MSQELIEDTPEIPEGFYLDDDTGTLVNESTGEVVEESPDSASKVSAKKESPAQSEAHNALKRDVGVMEYRAVIDGLSGIEAQGKLLEQRFGEVERRLDEHRSDSPVLKPGNGQPKFIAALVITAVLSAGLGYWVAVQSSADGSRDLAWSLVGDQLSWCFQEVQRGNYEVGSEVACEIKVPKQ